jgi:hypothetical protein
LEGTFLGRLMVVSSWHLEAQATHLVGPVLLKRCPPLVLFTLVFPASKKPARGLGDLAVSLIAQKSGYLGITRTWSGTTFARVRSFGASGRNCGGGAHSCDNSRTSFGSACLAGQVGPGMPSTRPPRAGRAGAGRQRVSWLPPSAGSSTRSAKAREWYGLKSGSTRMFASSDSRRPAYRGRRRDDVLVVDGAMR